MDLFEKYFSKCFRGTRLSEEVSMDNWKYTGEFSFGTFRWKGAMRDPTPYVRCCNSKTNQCGAFWWFVAFCRIVPWSLTLAFLVVQAGIIKNIKSEDGIVPFGWMANQIISIFGLIYVGLGWLFYFTICCPSVDSSMNEYEHVPWPFRVTWVLYDIALPGSVAGIILFAAFYENPYTPYTKAYTEQVYLTQMTYASYSCALIMMVFDALFGQMILMPSHVYTLIAAWLPYAAGLFYTGTLPMTVWGFASFLQATIFLILTYVAFSNITYARAACSLDTSSSPIDYKGLGTLDTGLDTEASEREVLHAEREVQAAERELKRNMAR